MDAAEMAKTIQPVVSSGIFGSPLTVNGLPSWGVLGLLVLAFMRGWLPWRKADDARDASMRADFMKMRAEDRAEHAQEIALIRKEQADERRSCEERLHAMQMQIDGLVRQLVAFQVSSGRAMGFTPEATASADRILSAIEKKQGEAE